MALTELKCDYRHGGKLSVPVAMAASQVITARSGKFVFMNNGAATLNVDGSTRIWGFLESEAETPATGEIKNCIIDLTAVFRIPVNSGTYVIGMIGDTCDISIVSNVQGAQLDASDENTIIIVGGDAVDSAWVDVMMSPAVHGTGAGSND